MLFGIEFYGNVFNFISKHFVVDPVAVVACFHCGITPRGAAVSYSAAARFGFRPGDRVFFGRGFRSFPSSLEANSRMIPCTLMSLASISVAVHTTFYSSTLRNSRS